jgi:hypothetical protein
MEDYLLLLTFGIINLNCFSVEYYVENIMVVAEMRKMKDNLLFF